MLEARVVHEGIAPHLGQSQNRTRNTWQSAACTLRPFPRRYLPRGRKSGDPGVAKRLIALPSPAQRAHLLPQRMRMRMRMQRVRMQPSVRTSCRSACTRCMATSMQRILQTAIASTSCAGGMVPPRLGC